jgi:hypothetical protein
MNNTYTIVYKCGGGIDSIRAKNINPTLWFNTPAGMDVILLNILHHNNHNPSVFDDIKTIIIAAAANGIYIPNITTQYRSGALVPNTHEIIQIPTKGFSNYVYSVAVSYTHLTLPTKLL